MRWAVGFVSGRTDAHPPPPTKQPPLSRGGAHCMLMLVVLVSEVNEVPRRVAALRVERPLAGILRGSKAGEHVPITLRHIRDRTPGGLPLLPSRITHHPPRPPDHRLLDSYAPRVARRRR